MKRPIFSAGLLLLVSCSAHEELPVKRSLDNSVNSIEYADTIYKNGVITTLDELNPRVDAVAIKGSLFIGVGSNQTISLLAGPNTTIVDLQGQMAMPGLVDAHVHPSRGGLKSLFECNFSFSATPEQIQHRVAECVKNNPNAEWIRGGQWDSGFFDRFDIASPREFLDEVSGDKAVLLTDDSNHNGWANSKALALSGIDRNTPDLSDGTYVRDANGIPNGLLLESAEQAMYVALPPWTETQFETAAEHGVKIANSFGITAMKEAASNLSQSKSWFKLDQQGRLNARIATAIRASDGHREEVLNYDQLDRVRDQFKSTNVYTDFVKIFIDGVPTASRSAAMLADYAGVEPKNPTAKGMLHVSEELLTRDLIELDKRGYTVKIHTAGDRSVRVALDAIEATRLANGDSGLRHELAHAGFIDPSDVPRFKELQAVADLSPYLWHPSPIIDSIILAVGRQRGEQYWPIKSLLDSNAPILAGSDWPAAVESINPWLGIEAMVTRQDPRGIAKGELWASQAVSLEQALKIYTQEGAKAMKMDHLIGSISVGKSADMIVLNQNLFEISPDKIGDTVVQKTLFQGRLVHQSD